MAASSGNTQTPCAGGADILFVYGTLVARQTRERLLGRRLNAIPARLPGFARARRRHFYLTPQAAGSARGLLLLGLTEREFAILDRYEDVPRLYRRERVEALDESGAQVTCWVYLPTGWER